MLICCLWCCVSVCVPVDLTTPLPLHMHHASVLVNRFFWLFNSYKSRYVLKSMFFCYELSLSSLSFYIYCRFQVADAHNRIFLFVFPIVNEWVTMVTWICFPSHAYHYIYFCFISIGCMAKLLYPRWLSLNSVYTFESELQAFKIDITHCMYCILSVGPSWSAVMK